MSSQTERDYITQGTGGAATRFPPPAQNQRSRLRAWGRREPRAPPLRSCGPACPRLCKLPPIPGDRRPRPRRPLLRDARARRACGRPRCAAVGARARAAPPGGRGQWGIPGPGPPSPGRAAPWPGCARARAHTCAQRAPRPPLPWGRAATRGPRGRARPLPQPARAPHPPLIVSLRNASAQRKDNGTPGKRGWRAPGLARSLTSRGRRRR